MGHPPTNTGLHAVGTGHSAGVLQEQALWQIFREAGATARHRPFLRDLTVSGVPGSDARQLDVVASGLPVFGGRTLVIDAM